MIRAFRLFVAHWQLKRALRRLERDVELRRQLAAQYPKRRAASKLGWQRRRAL